VRCKVCGGAAHTSGSCVIGHATRMPMARPSLSTVGPSSPTAKIAKQCMYEAGVSQHDTPERAPLYAHATPHSRVSCLVICILCLELVQADVFGLLHHLCTWGLARMHCSKVHMHLAAVHVVAYCCALPFIQLAAEGRDTRRCMLRTMAALVRNGSSLGPMCVACQLRQLDSFVNGASFDLIKGPVMKEVLACNQG